MLLREPTPSTPGVRIEGSGPYHPTRYPTPCVPHPPCPVPPRTPAVLQRRAHAEHEVRHVLRSHGGGPGGEAQLGLQQRLGGLKLLIGGTRGVVVLRYKRSASLRGYITRAWVPLPSRALWNGKGRVGVPS